jgi:hypothetical protein
MSSLRGRHLRLGLVRLMSRRNSPGFGHFKWAVKSRSRLGRSDARIGAGSEEPNSGNRQLIPASFVPRETKFLERGSCVAPQRTPPNAAVRRGWGAGSRRVRGSCREELRPGTPRAARSGVAPSAGGQPCVEAAPRVRDDRGPCRGLPSAADARSAAVTDAGSSQCNTHGSPDGCPTTGRSCERYLGIQRGRPWLSPTQR